MYLYEKIVFFSVNPSLFFENIFLNTMDNRSLKISLPDEFGYNFFLDQFISLELLEEDRPFFDCSVDILTKLFDICLSSFHNNLDLAQ